MNLCSVLFYFKQIAIELNGDLTCNYIPPDEFHTKIKFILLLFEIWPFVYMTISGFSCLKINQKLHGGDRRYVKKKQSQKQWMSYYSTHANLNCPYLKIDLCYLFLVLLDYITYVQKAFLDSNFNQAVIDKNTNFSWNCPKFDIVLQNAIFLQYLERDRPTRFAL